MQEIIFYDSKNVPYMTWYNFSYNQQNGTLLFNNSSLKIRQA